MKKELLVFIIAAAILPVIGCSEAKMQKRGSVTSDSFRYFTQIGDSTAGDFSDVSFVRFLPNGWVYHYSTMMYLMPDGSSLDGIGHVPDICVKNSPSDIANRTDKVIEKAIEYLYNTHGIE